MLENSLQYELCLSWETLRKQAMKMPDKQFHLFLLEKASYFLFSFLNCFTRKIIIIFFLLEWNVLNTIDLKLTKEVSTAWPSLTLRRANRSGLHIDSAGCRAQILFSRWQFHFRPFCPHLKVERVSYKINWVPFLFLPLLSQLRIQLWGPLSLQVYLNQQTQLFGIPPWAEFSVPWSKARFFYLQVLWLWIFHLWDSTFWWWPSIK